MKTKISNYLKNLSADKIEEVIRDFELLDEGYKLHYAVDPHEMVDFCFPVIPENKSEHDINQIADDQIALNEIFFINQNPPLLLDAYFREVNGLMRYFANVFQEAYDHAKWINTLIEEGELDKPEFAESENLKTVEEKFNVLLAVVYGIYSLGVKRFEEIYNKIDSKGGFVYRNRGFYNEKQASEFSEILNNYERTDIFTLIFNKIFESRKQIPFVKSEIERLRQSSTRDAEAIDQICHLNRILIDKYRDNSNEKHLILYLSSAPRTETVFNDKFIIENLPSINSKPYSFYRTRSQVFFALVNQTGTDFKQSIVNLREIQKIILSMQKNEQKDKTKFNFCSNCVTDGFDNATCEHRFDCQEIKKYDWVKKRIDERFEKRRQETLNIGLAGNLTRFQEFVANARNTLQSKPENSIQKRCIEILKNFLRNNSALWLIK